MRHTVASKQRLSRMRRGSGNPFFGRKHTPATRAKLAANLRSYQANRQIEISARTIRIPTEVSLGYLAGLIDGEGSVRFKRGRPFVAVYNTEKRIMDWLIAAVGGHVVGHDRRGRRVCYTWCVAGARDVWALCRALEPHTLAKRLDIAAALFDLRKRYGEERLDG